MFSFGSRKTKSNNGTVPKSPSGPPALNDPKDPRIPVEASNLKSDVIPAGRGAIPNPASREYRDLVNECMEVYTASREAHLSRMQKWELFQRCYDGEQWAVIDEAHGVVDSREDQYDLDRSKTFNYTFHIVERLVSYLTQNDPQVSCHPLCETALDKQAAVEADGLSGKMYRDHDIRELRKRQLRHALITTTSYRYWGWDSSKYDLLPKYDDLTGEMIGASREQVGGLWVQVLSGREVFWDASTRRSEDAYQCVIARVKPLSWLQATYGDAAYGLSADSYSSGYVTPLPYYDEGNIVNPVAGKGTRRDSCNVYEWLIRPNPMGRWKNGLYMVVSGNRILYKSDWPWADKENWPLSPISYVQNDTMPYGKSLVELLYDAQQTINRETSRILARLEKDKRIVFIQKLSGVGVDDFVELKDLYKSYYNPGSPAPTVANMPPINGDHKMMIDRAIAFMDTVSGIVDVMRGETPASQMSGYMYDLMIESASNILAPLMQDIGRNEVNFLKGAISEYADKGAPELMMGLDPRGNKPVATDGSVGQVTALEAISDGGQVELYLAPTSGLLKSPAGQEKELAEKYQMSLLGPVGTPEAAMVFWKLTNSPLSAKVLPLLEEQQAMLAQMAQQQPDPAAIEQAKVQAQLQVVEAKGENDLDRLRLQHNLKLQEMQAQASLDAMVADAEEQHAMAQMPQQMALQDRERQLAKQDQLESTVLQHSLGQQAEADKHKRELEKIKTQGMLQKMLKPKTTPAKKK